MTINVNVLKLKDNAVLPEYATSGSGCFDLRATEEGEIQDSNGINVGTGLAFEIPEEYVMLVFSRSGHGFKNGVRLKNCVGVIDSDYRGEVRVGLVQDGEHEGVFKVNVGDRIAQAAIVRAETVNFFEVSALSETSRGAGGFGSTGHQ